jgi:hypothetical protein
VSDRYRVLHIADPHFTNCHFDTKKPRDMGSLHAEELIQQLEGFELLSSPFDVIVFSGDFTFGCKPEGFVAAEEFIRELASRVPEARMLVIPGNHDVNLQKPIVIGKFSLPTSKAEAEKPFRTFLHKIQSHVGEPSEYLSMMIRVPGSPGLVVIGLNSCRVERRDAQGWGYVGKDQIDHVVRQLLKADGAKDDDIVVAVTHHNLLPIWDLGIQILYHIPERRKFSFTMDAGGALGFLADLGVCALLHGHTHVQSMKRVQGYGLHDGQKTPMLVLGAGSLGIVGQRDDPPHHCQIIEIDTKEGEVIYQDLHPGPEPRNSRRVWTRTKSPTYYVSGLWKNPNARRALDLHKVDSHRASFDYENMQSWSQLRAKELSPKTWSKVVDELFERVRRIESSATRAKVLRTIEDIFLNPPSEREICEWMLESYIARYLK